MCRPLKDIVAELDEIYSHLKLYDLQERSHIIADFEKDADYMFSRFDEYYDDIRFVLDHHLDKNIISRMTMNLILVMQYMYKSVLTYGLVINNYLMDDYYEKNHDMYSSFIDAHQKLKRLLDKMQENNIFEVDTPNEVDVLDLFYDSPDPFDNSSPALRAQQFESKEIEGFNGAELMIILDHLCEFFESILDSIKNYTVYASIDILNYTYYYNYYLYAKLYWPKHVTKFRSYVEHQRLRGKVDINKLELLRDELSRDFGYNTQPGRIWRDYWENKSDLTIQMKSQKLNAEQWEYFFKTVFELDEFDRWIEELRINSSAEMLKAKEKAAVLTENKEFMRILQKAIKQGFCQQDGWRYKWGVKVEAAYFASLANEKFNLSKRKINGKKPAVSWIPFEALFGLNDLRTAFNDYKQCKTSLVREEEIDKLFE